MLCKSKVSLHALRQNATRSLHTTTMSCLQEARAGARAISTLPAHATQAQPNLQAACAQILRHQQQQWVRHSSTQHVETLRAELCKRALADGRLSTAAAHCWGCKVGRPAKCDVQLSHALTHSTPTQPAAGRHKTRPHTLKKGAPHAHNMCQQPCGLDVLLRSTPRCQDMPCAWPVQHKPQAVAHQHAASAAALLCLTGPRDTQVLYSAASQVAYPPGPGGC